MRLNSDIHNAYYLSRHDTHAECKILIKEDLSGHYHFSRTRSRRGGDNVTNGT